jgi:regulatory protein YycI of two-component signal transduction system YycFG
MIFPSHIKIDWYDHMALSKKETGKDLRKNFMSTVIHGSKYKGDYSLV